MEERAAHLLVGVLVVSCGVIESAQKFLAADLVRAFVRELIYERTYGFIVRNGESVCVASHFPTSFRTLGLQLGFR
jgi:hypothetical protein